MEATLNRFRPAGLNETLTDAFGIEVFYSTELKKAIFYAGKSKKQWWFYRFSSVDEMIQRIYKSVDVYVNRCNEKAEQAAKQKAAMSGFKACDFFKVGDVVVNSWGYEQTNVDFYQVTEVLNKKIRVREIASKIVENSMYSHGMACEVVPAIDEFIENQRKEISILTLKADVNKSGEILCRICNPESFYYFQKWDGKPEYKSWYY
jgi:hypothetical protein